MEIYVAVFVIFIIVVLLVGGAVIILSLNFIHLKLHVGINWIKRFFWERSLGNLPNEELRKMSTDLETALVILKSEDNKLSAGLGVKGREAENFFLMFKIDAVEAQINDGEAKINILKSLIR